MTVCAASDVGRTLRARSGVIQAVHDSLHELGVYAPSGRGEARGLATEA